MLERPKSQTFWVYMGPAPRVILEPKFGLAIIGRTRKDVTIGQTSTLASIKTLPVRTFFRLNIAGGDEPVN